MNDPADRLRHAREKSGFGDASEAARRFGWATSTYLGHENGSRGLRPEVALKYARAFKVEPDWLMFGRGVPALAERAEEDDRDLVPIFDIEASAGHGAIPSEYEEIAGRMSFPPGYLRHITSTPVDKLAIVTVVGDSMTPTLRPRDVVLVDKTKINLGYDGLFVLRMDGVLHVKRITRGSRAGQLRILSDNRDAYPPYERAMEDVQAVGKVLWYGRKE